MLKVEYIPPGDACYGTSVGFMVRHHFIVTGDPLHGGVGKNTPGQCQKLIARVLPDVPGVATQRHRPIRGGDPSLSPRSEHAMYFPEKGQVVLNMFDHLKAHDGVKLIVCQIRERRYVSCHEAPGRIALPQHIKGFINLIECRIRTDLVYEQTNAATFATADFKKIARYQVARHHIGFQQALMYGSVGGILIAGYLSCVDGHNSIDKGSKLRFTSDPSQTVRNLPVMVRIVFMATILLVQTPALVAQAITGINFSYIYDADAEVDFRIRAVRAGQHVTLYYRLTSNRKDVPVADFTVTWERRTSVNVRSGTVLESQPKVLNSDNLSITSSLRVETGAKTWFALAKVVNRTTRAEYFFYQPIEANWPGNGLLEDATGAIVFDDFIQVGANYRVKQADPVSPVYVFRYRRTFSPAAPPFARNAADDQFLKADSSFRLTSAEFTPTSPGLYLFQQDTASAEGLAVYAGDPPYPRYNRVAALAGPLIYLTTADEQTALANAGQDKAKFDRVILEITREKDRAKSLMRSYFQKVEQTNRLFTGHKEGWKTDQGMIYLIFGAPSEISRTTANEIWYYKSTQLKFVFYRRGSIYDPWSYFLQRSDSYTQEWYSTIDLWRKGRF